VLGLAEVGAVIDLDAGLGQHLEPVAAEQPGDGGLAGEIGGAREAGRELAGEQVDRGRAARAGHDERERVALAEHPRIHHDHALGREQRAIDQAPVAGALEVVGEQALEAGQRTRPAHANHGRLGDHQGGPVAHPVETGAVEPEVELSHGATAARRESGR
jgi:hypothetical protein